jgi:hypothetical protein
MARTPDRRPGESDEEGIVFENRPAGQDPPLSGGFRYVTGSFRLRDKLGVFDPRNPSGGQDYDVQFALSGSLTGSSALTFNPDTSTLSTTNLTGSLTKLRDGSSYIVGGDNIIVTTGSNGSITISTTLVTATSFSVPFTDATVVNINHTIGVSIYDIEVFDTNHNKIIPKSATAVSSTSAQVTFGSPTSGYVLVGSVGEGGGASDSTFAGLGLIKSASSPTTFVLSIDDSVVATLSGSTFSGPVIFSAGLSGSLTTLTDGSPYLIPGENVVITTGSNGSVTISTSLSTATTASFTSITSITVNHNLGVTLYDIEVFDTGNSKIIPKSATATSPTSSVITFGGPTSGYVMVGSPGGSHSTGFPTTTLDSFDCDGVTSSFATSILSSQNKMFVFINGLYKHPVEDYTVSGSQLNLLQVPLSGSKVRVRYLTQTN